MTAGGQPYDSHLSDLEQLGDHLGDHLSDLEQLGDHLGDLLSDLDQLGDQLGRSLDQLGQVPGPAGTQESAISQDPGRSWKKASKPRFSSISSISSFFAFWRNFAKSAVWGGRRDPRIWGLLGRPGVLYRPLITAKHFPNDRPNRGPIFRFRCTNPHETVIFCLNF